MQLSSLIIERNQQEFAAFTSLLVVNPPAQDSLAALAPARVVTHDYRVAQSLRTQLQERLCYGLQILTDQSHDAALVFMPKSKGELSLLLVFVNSLISPGAPVYLVGEKKQGIASGAKRLAELGEQTFKVDSAKHCQLWCTRTSPEKGPVSFQLQDWFEQYTVSIGQEDYDFASIPGVFSYERLDEGSAMLIDSMIEAPAKRIQGRTLDFGCGSGPIGIVAKKRNPDIALEMVDINWLALECAKRSCALNGVEASVYASDGWSDIDGRFDTVLSNPPFHSGVATEYQTTEHFIRGAYDHMNRYASLMLVANAFLKYPGLIESRFGRCDTLNESSRFKVYTTFR